MTFKTYLFPWIALRQTYLKEIGTICFPFHYAGNHTSALFIAECSDYSNPMYLV